MGNVVAVQVDQETSTLLGQLDCVADDSRVESVAELSTALERLERDPSTIDALVLGPLLDEPVRVAQHVQSVDKDLAVVILSDPQRHGLLSKAIQFSPFLGNEVDCRSTNQRDTLPAALDLAVTRTRQRRSHRATVAAVQESLKAPSGTGQLPAHYLDRLLDYAPIGVVAVDSLGMVQAWNRRAGDILGMSERDALGISLSCLFADVERSKFLSFIAQCISSEMPNTQQVFARHSEGDKQFVEITAGALTGRTGEPGAMVLLQDVTDRWQAAEDVRTARDGLEVRVAERTADLVRTNMELAGEIRERQRAERALQDSEALYHSLVRHVPMRVFRKDLQGRFTFANEEFCRDHGRPLEELLGTTDLDYARPELAEKYQADDRRVAETEQVFHDVEQHDDAEGNRSWVEVLKTAVHDHEATVVGTQGMYWDVTDRRLAEEQLQRTTEELARSNVELAQFAHVVSHDLQEPLRAVAGYCELLRKRYGRKLDTQAEEFIEFAVEGSRRMQALIDGLLEYSRVDTLGSGPVQTECERVLHDALANLKTVIVESGAHVTHEPLPAVTGDRTQLVQLFQNLVSNAIKYRSERVPEVHICAKQHSGEWLFSIQDNGMGIEPKYTEKIFVIFHRLHTREEHPGTGLGLAICKKIVERHGGRIYVDSRLGVGSTFHFTIPSCQSKN